LARILVTFFSLPGSFADALGVGIGHGHLPAEVTGSTRPVFPTIGRSTQIGVARRSDKARLAGTGLGATIAIRIGGVTSPRAFAGTLGGFDDSCCFAVPFLEVTVDIVVPSIAVNDGFVGGLVS